MKSKYGIKKFVKKEIPDDEPEERNESSIQDTFKVSDLYEKS
jgi:hypothetical protein